MIVVAKIKQTCEACPSQWEGVTDTGERVYVRYRWGHLQVEVDGKTVFTKTCGDHLDGCMYAGQLREITKGRIAWPEFMA